MIVNRVSDEPARHLFIKHKKTTMNHSRLFFKQDLEFELEDNGRLSDATETAQQFGFIFQLHVETAFLSGYHAPNAFFDDQGVELVGAVVRSLEDALFGRSSACVVSRGKYLSLCFRLAAVPQRSSRPESVLMSALIGPCDSDHPSAYIVRANSPRF